METQFCHLYLHKKELCTWLSIRAQFFNLNTPACPFSYEIQRLDMIWLNVNWSHVVWMGMYSIVFCNKKCQIMKSFVSIRAPMFWCNMLKMAMSLNSYKNIYLNMYAPNKLLRSIVLQCFGMEIRNVSIKKQYTAINLLSWTILQENSFLSLKSVVILALNFSNSKARPSVADLLTSLLMLKERQYVSTLPKYYHKYTQISHIFLQIRKMTTIEYSTAQQKEKQDGKIVFLDIV